MEHSRSPRWRTFPCESPMICTSMCRPWVIYGSIKTLPSPNADSASLDAELMASARSACFSTMRIPRPPPPAAALTMTGILTFGGFSPGWTSVEVTVGTPASIAACFANILSPRSAICSGVGPIHMRPASLTLCANCAFSAKNPYPGWIASQSFC